MKVVLAAGDPLSRCRHIGRGLRDQIVRSVDFYRRYFGRRGISSERLQELLARYLAAAEADLSSFVSVLQGMSEGAAVSMVELFAINAFEELEPLVNGTDFQSRALGGGKGRVARASRPERCTSFVVATQGSTILAHNKHWLACDGDNVAVVVEAPDDASAPVASPTIAWCLPAVGINGHGVAQGIASLTASDDRVGVPCVLVSRSSLEAQEQEDALARANLPARSGGYGHTFAFPGGRSPVVDGRAGRDRGGRAGAHQPLRRP